MDELYCTSCQETVRITREKISAKGEVRYFECSCTQNPSGTYAESWDWR